MRMWRNGTQQLHLAQGTCLHHGGEPWREERGCGGYPLHDTDSLVGKQYARDASAPCIEWIEDENRVDVVDGKVDNRLQSGGGMILDAP